MVSIKLKKLFKDHRVSIHGQDDVEILGLCSHSRTIRTGDLFIARKGTQTNGALFIEEALAAGAAAILTDFYNPLLSKKVPQVIHQEPELLEPLLAKMFYQDPSASLFTAGITGTNGKTTTSFLMAHLLEDKPFDCGIIGTVENRIGRRIFPSKLTTPDIITLQKFLKDMVSVECSSAVMEVTSHAIHQKRIEGIDFDIAVFTNLTQDHLDYHQTMDQYVEAKAKFFDNFASQASVKPWKKTAIINQDDPYSARMIEQTKAQVMTYGIEKPSDVMATEIKYLPDCTKFYLTIKGDGPHKILSPLVGKFNVYNLLAAIAGAYVKGKSLQSIQSKLMSFEGVPARLQRIDVGLSFSIFVDFAHTEDALKNVLLTLIDLKQGGRVITVFGCGGDRDRLKRPKMGQIAESLSDVVIVTSDNPRSEKPDDILQDILSGFKEPSKALLEIDRYKAIKQALNMAEKDDIVLIAGKGHEKVQIFHDRSIEFDDVKVIKELSSLI